MGNTILLLAGLGVMGVIGYVVYKKVSASGSAASSEDVNATESFLTGLGTGLGSGVKDWFASGQNSNSGSQWADDTSWFGSGDTFGW